jgi:hypothetical protein
MLEVSRDAASAGEEQIVSCAAEQRKYCSICTEPLALAAVFPLRVGVVGSVFAVAQTYFKTIVNPPAVAAHWISVDPGSVCRHA